MVRSGSEPGSMTGSALFQIEQELQPTSVTTAPKLEAWKAQ